MDRKKSFGIFLYLVVAVLSASWATWFLINIPFWSDFLELVPIILLSLTMAYDLYKRDEVSRRHLVVGIISFLALVGFTVLYIILPLEKVSPFIYRIG